MSSEGKCMSCGGKVDAHGYALGGEVPDDEFGTPQADNAAEPTSQDQDDAELVRNAERRFVRAVRSSR